LRVKKTRPDIGPLRRTEPHAKVAKDAKWGTDRRQKKTGHDERDEEDTFNMRERRETETILNFKTW
jgi:hypothetical protein